MIKGAVFDMDGTLFDTERLYRISWSYAAEYLSGRVEKDFPAGMCCANGRDAINNLHKYYPELVLDDVSKICMKKMHELLLKNIPIKTGVKEMLSYLKANKIKMAIASSSSHALIENNITKTRIKNYFNEIISGEDVENGKPSPDIFNLAAEKLSLNTNECIIFEDSNNGAYASIKAGGNTIMVIDMMIPDTFVEKNCVAICNNMHEALDYIKNNKLLGV